MTIWWRHLFLDCLKALGGFLVVIATLYVVIDLSVHGKLLSQANIPIIRYYIGQLVYRAPFLVPLALLLATLKSILTLKHHRELLALRAAGIRPQQILSPYLTVALIAAVMLYANYQLAFPSACRLIDQTSQETFGIKGAVHALRLADGSKLLYQRYDPLEHKLFDCYWIRSDSDIYRLKYLFPHRDPPLATYVDHLVRADDGTLGVIEHFTNTTLAQLSLVDHTDFLPAEALAPTTLFRRLPRVSTHLSDRDLEWLSQFHAKLALPWTGLLIVLALSPLCSHFSRQMPAFSIYGIALLAFLALQTAIDVILMLETSHTINPIVGIWTLMGGLLTICGVRFLKLA